MEKKMSNSSSATPFAPRSWGDVSTLYLIENIACLMWALALFFGFLIQLYLEQAIKVPKKGYAYVWRRAILVVVINLIVLNIDPHSYYGVSPALAWLVDNLVLLSLNVIIAAACVALMSYNLLMALVSILESIGSHTDRELLLPFIAKLKFFFFVTPIINGLGNIIGIALMAGEQNLYWVVINSIANAISFLLLFSVNVWSCRFLRRMLMENNSLSEDRSMDNQLSTMIAVSCFGGFWIAVTCAYNAIIHTIGGLYQDGGYDNDLEGIGDPFGWTFNDRNSGMGSQLLVVSAALLQIWMFPARERWGTVFCPCCGESESSLDLSQQGYSN